VEKGRALHLLGGIGALLFAMVLLLTTEITHARGHDAEHVILPWVFFHLVATVLVACGHAGQARAGDGRFAWVGLALVLSPLAICPLLGVGGDGVVRYFLPMVLSFAWLGSGRALLRAPAGTAPVLGNVAGATLIVAFALAALATVLAWISLLFEARLPGDLALGLIPRFVDSATLGYALAAVWFLRRLGTR
jgi:hypothetical protein